MAKQLVKHRTRVRAVDTNVNKVIGQGVYGGFSQKGSSVSVIIMNRGMGEPYSIKTNGTLVGAPYLKLQFLAGTGWLALTHIWLGIKAPATGKAKKKQRGQRRKSKGKRRKR